MPLPILIVTSGALAYAGFKLYNGLKKTKSISSSPVKTKNNLQVVKNDNDLNEMLKKNANRDFTISSASLGLTVVGTLYYPPLVVAGMVGIIYISIPLLRRGYQSIFKKHKVDGTVIDSIALPGILITGNYLIAAVGYWIYALSQKLLLKIEDQSIKSLINVFGEQPRSVWVLKDNVELEIPFDALKVDDIIVVNAGETIPVDGIITKGIASIDQHTLTGESQPAEKGVDDQVFASTLVLSGEIHIQVKQAGKDTVAAKIGELLISTTDFKSTTQSYGEQVSDKSALPALVVGALAIPVSGYTGGLAVLFAQPGENMRIIAPLSTLNYLKIASNRGILIKDGRALELLSKVDTVVFDKTGTLTQEQPHVGKIYTLQDREENELLMYAAAAEYKQAHPVAKAIIQAANKRKLSLPDIEDAKYEVGYGIKVSITNQLIRVGSVRFMEMEGIAIPEEIENIMSDCHSYGYSLVMVAIDNQLGGAIELHATIRPEAKSIIKDLHQRNMSTYIISGDHEKPTQQLAKELGIDNYFADTLPENKANLIQQLSDAGKVVCFVGDGINDSIALKKAHVSISLKGASTIATDTAQIILMDESLKHLCQLFDLANELESNLNTGLITTIIPGLVIVGGVFLRHMGIIGSIVVFNIGLLAGVANSMWPLVESHKKAKKLH
jgi:Cu2+-exporting ATPase